MLGRKIVSGVMLLMLLSITTTVQSQELTLEQCIERAKTNNKKLKISTNEKEIVEQKRKEVKSNLIPKVAINGDYKYYIDLPYQMMPLSAFDGPEGVFKEIQFGVPHNFTANLNLSMPLYNPEVYGGINATKIAVELADLQHQKTEDQVYFEIAYLYYNAQILKNQINFIDSNLINSQKLLKNVELLNQQQLAQKTDVEKVELQILQAETNKLNLQSRYTQALNGLKIYMGDSLNAAIEIETVVLHEEGIEYDQFSLIDVKLLDAKYSLLSSELKTLQRTRYLPSIYLYGSYGILGYGYNGSPEDFVNIYPVGFVGLKLNYPIFNGTVTTKKIKQKNLEIANNDLRKSMVTDQQNNQIENAQLQRVVAKKSITSAEKQMKLAQTIYGKILLQNTVGMASLSDVLLADNDLREAQQAYISAIVNYMKADLEIKKLTGNI